MKNFSKEKKGKNIGLDSWIEEKKGQKMNERFSSASKVIYILNSQ